MMSARRFGFAAALMLSSAAVGCAGDDGSVNAPETGEVSAPVVKADAQADQHAEMHGRFARGPARLLVVALRDLTLTDVQKGRIEAALDKLKTDLGDRGDKAGDPEGPKALAAAIRAGKVDEAALAPKADQAPPTEAFAAAIDTLHSTLTKAQREELVKIVEKKREEHADGPRGDHGDRAGKGDESDQADKADKAERVGRGDKGGKGGKGGKGMLGHLLGDLSLTEAQRDAVEKALESEAGARPEPPSQADRDAMHAAMKQRLESFAADSFDAKAFVAPPDGAKGRMGDPRRGFVSVLAKVVPLLDAAQREKLAAKIEQGPPAGRGGKWGGHREGGKGGLQRGAAKGNEAQQ